MSCVVVSFAATDTPSSVEVVYGYWHWS